MSLPPSLTEWTKNNLNTPCSARYIVQTRFGWTEQTLSFDLLGMNSTPQYIPVALWSLWTLLVAPATVRSSSLVWMEWVYWKAAPLAQPYVGPFTTGRIVEQTRSRDEQLVLVLHSGHADEYAGRRFFLPGTPAGWSEDGVLTTRGYENGMDMVNAWAMAALAWYCGGTVSLIHAYPGLLPSVPENLAGVAFRLVSDIRLCQYVDKAPELSSSLWP